MDKDLLHKIFVSLRGIKQELYAKSFQVNDIRENLPPHVENARRKPHTVKWYWSAGTLFWQLSINQNIDVQYVSIISFPVLPN